MAARTKPAKSTKTKPTATKPTKAPPAKAASRKPDKPRPAAKPASDGRPGLQALFGALAKQKPRATIDHGGFNLHAFAWGGRWVLGFVDEPGSQFDEARWTFVLVDPDGGETDRVVFEKETISKAFVAGDELVLICGQPPGLRVVVFRQTPAGKLDRVATREGDASTQHLWTNERPMIAIGERLVLAQDRDTKSLVVYERGARFALTERSATKIVIGEKSAFIDNEGFRGAAISGSRAILSGPSHKTGYQLLDLSTPGRPTVIANARSTGPALPEIVAAIGPDRFVAYGGGGKLLVLDHDATEGTLVVHKAIDLGLYYEGLYREGDELLLYNGNMPKPFGIGVSLGDTPKQLGKLPLPAKDVQLISRIGARLLFVTASNALLYDA